MTCCSCNEIVGYRFHPTDKELIDHYLWNKALDRDSSVQAIGDVIGDLCDWEPGELPRFSVRRSNDRTWYLFSRRNHSKRVKRTTKLGYWKLTGKHRSIKAKIGIGTKKTLVFYEGRVPKGKWTPWVIHEYTLPNTLPNQKGFFLCKLKKKDDEKVKKKDDEKADISSGEGQPSNVKDDKTFDNSLGIDVDELLAQLGETDGSNEVGDGAASAQETHMFGEHVSVFSSNGACAGDCFDRLLYPSSTNEQNDELYLVPSALQSHMHDGQVLSHDDLSFFCASNDNFHEIQHQSSTTEQDDKIQHQPSTNEQDDEIQHQPSTIEQDDEIHHQPSTIEQDDEIQHQPSTHVQDDEVQHQPSTHVQEDELWNYNFVDDDERSNELFCWSESSGFLLG